MAKTKAKSTKAKKRGPGRPKGSKNKATKSTTKTVKSGKKPMTDALKTKYNAWLKRLGRTIAGIRKDRKLTQAKMAEKTGFDMKYYQDLEYGRRPITTRTLFQLCDGIEMSVQDLINLAEKHED